MALTGQTYDLVIVGAGPAGLEAALQAKQAGMNALLIDREEAGSVIANTMSGKRFYHAYGRNVELPRGLLDFPDRKEGGELVLRWRKQAADLNYLSHTVFKTIDNSSQIYKFITDRGVITAPKLILATGLFAKPNRLGVPGEAGNHFICYEFDYRSFMVGKQVLVVGAGNSAVETALELSLDNEVTLLVRKPQLALSVTERNRTELEKEINKATIQILYNSTVTEFNQQDVSMKVSDTIQKKFFDQIYIHIGYEKPSDWLRSLTLELDQNGLPKLSKNLETSREGIFVVGALTGNDSIVGSANQSISVVKHLASRAIL